MDSKLEIPVALKQLITANQAFHYRIVPMERIGDQIIFKTDTENLKDLEQQLQILFGYKLILEKETTETLQAYLSLNYRQYSTPKTHELNYKQNFLQQLIQTARDYESSDIHLEPYENRCRVRFRMDGKLKEEYSILSEEYPQIINQIKIQAGLDISQKRLSQDGRITISTVQQEFDIRVSTLPTLHGEKIVLRILKRNVDKISLEDLGFTENELSLYLEGIKKPHGIILISGPTGSGKTTTLYGTLKLLNQEHTNIVTIEDPIEYTLTGINQVQLKEDIGFDFPSALRTFLRQDPDIIMVGEIRDEKTATMATKAALTGHLVLSTIHTNSAWATVSRLIDMGIPPYLISSTLNLSVAQRLVRRLCNQCKKSASINGTSHLVPRLHYKSYDSRGNPIEIAQEAGPSVFYFWSVDSKPIAKIENTSAAAIDSGLTTLMENLNESHLNQLHDLRSSLPNAFISTYSWNHAGRIEQITDPRNTSRDFRYDDFLRLQKSLDHQDHILFELKYGFKDE